MIERAPCAWCDKQIPPEARIDSIYHSKSCRQAAHRFRAGHTPRPSTTDQPLRLAYADPPYPGLSARYYADHEDFDGEVDHGVLARQLVEGFPDGWAISTNSRSTEMVLGHLRAAGAEGPIHISAWFRGARPTRSHLPLDAWEPVLWQGGRQEVPTLEHGHRPTDRENALVYVARARRTDPKRVTGAKPASFIWWLFDLLGAEQGDEIVDFFAGSGGVTRAWRILQEGAPRPQETDRAIHPRQLGLEVSVYPEPPETVARRLLER